MRRFLLLMSVVTLGAGVTRAQEHVDPAEILEDAVDRYARCDFKGEQAEFGEDEGVSGWKPLTEKQRGMVENLTLALLFKPGRFDTGKEVVRTDFGNKPAVIVSFVPWPPGNQLKPERGENRDSVRIMNSLSGQVLIDEATREIISINTKVTGSFKMRWKKLIPWSLEHMSVHLSQAQSGDRWVPNKLAMTMTGTWLWAGNFLEHYRAQFICAPS